MAILTVGTGGQYQTIAAAVSAAVNGDVVQVAAGTYTNDFVHITASITLEAVGGMAIIQATVPPTDHKGIITAGATGADITISGFELTGAAVSDDDGANGAGIRYQGGNLTLVNDYIYGNQDGIMGDPAVAGTGTVTIADSEFADNGNASGPGSGYAHNIYIGNVATFSISNSLIVGALVGHEIKSRALDTVVSGCTIVDGPGGTASYDIDLSRGGDASITGNTIEKGPNAQNPYFISYGEEGVTNPGTLVEIAGNIFVNDLASPHVTAVRNDSANPVDFNANSVYALTADQLIDGPGTATDTSFLAAEPTIDTTPPWSGAAQPAQSWLPCFLSGTHIATPRGPWAVERLRVGDPVLTAAGCVRPVAWLGRRAVACTLHAHPEQVWPVRIRAGAFAPGQPERDLFLSPDHAVFADGVLIPVRLLVNGRTVVQQPMPRLVYWHVELADHDLLLAEGLAVESYLDTGNRNQFANVLSYIEADSERASPSSRPCRPTVTSGEVLDRVCAHLAERADWPGLGVDAAALALRPGALQWNSQPV